MRRYNARVDSCSHCGGALPADAIFCPSCGRRTDAPPIEPRDVPIDVQHAKPRYFGLGPPIFVLSLAVVLIVVGVVLLGHGLGRRRPESTLPSLSAYCRRSWQGRGAGPTPRIARAGISTADRLRDEEDAAATSIATWSRAGRTVVRLRNENQLRRRRERDAKIRELGLSSSTRTAGRTR